MKNKNSNKLVIVTGASKGIGRAVAQLFAKKGYALSICSRTQKDIKRLAAYLGKFTPNVHFQAIDVADGEQVRDYAEAILKLRSKPVLLVNNAGVFIPGKIHDEPEGRLELMFKTNLVSAYSLSRALIPQFKKQGSGHIINICSTASNTAYVDGGSYCISKFAMLGFNKVLRKEMQSFGIKVTAVLPGATLTDSWKETEHPKDRFMPAEEVAEVVWNAFNTGARTNIEEIVMRPQLGDF